MDHLYQGNILFSGKYTNEYMQLEDNIKLDEIEGFTDKSVCKIFCNVKSVTLENKLKESVCYSKWKKHRENC